MFANLEEFQHPQIKLHLTGSNEGVPGKTERTRRQRKCATAVSIEASQRIDGPAAANYQDRSGFNVAEKLRDHSAGFLGLLLVSEREIESSTEHEPMLLIVGR